MESNMKQRKSKKFVLAIIVLLALCVFCAILLLDGCAAGSGAAAGGADSGAGAGSDSAKNAAQTAQTNEKDAEGNMIIGNAEADAWDLKLTNRAEKSITGVAVKYPDAENHTANLMYEGSHISAGESAILKVEKRGGAGDSAGAGGAGAGGAGAGAGGAQNTTVASYYVDIKITFLDGTVSDLHHIDVRDTGELNIYLQGKIAYCIYQSAAAGAMVSTLELQTWWYNHDDPEAAARDAQEEEQERRRLEKLEEDLRTYEENNNSSQGSSAQSTSGSTSNTSGTSAENTEDVQSNSLSDDPIETNYDGPEED